MRLWVQDFYISSGIFFRRVLWAGSVSPWLNTICLSGTMIKILPLDLLVASHRIPLKMKNGVYRLQISALVPEIFVWKIHKICKWDAWWRHILNPILWDSKNWKQKNWPYGWRIELLYFLEMKHFFSHASYWWNLFAGICLSMLLHFYLIELLQIWRHCGNCKWNVVHIQHAHKMRRLPMFTEELLKG